MALRQDFVIEKGAVFAREINIVDANNAPVSLVGKNIACIIKESLSTSTVLFHLTEANGGVTVVNDAEGKVALYISAADTNVEASHGVYNILRIDDEYPLLDIERILEGRIAFTEGV